MLKRFLSLLPSGGCAGVMPVTKRIVNNLQIMVVWMDNYAIV
jgi:hypothetical protein